MKKPTIQIKVSSPYVSSNEVPPNSSHPSVNPPLYTSSLASQQSKAIHSHSSFLSSIRCYEDISKESMSRVEKTSLFCQTNAACSQKQKEQLELNMCMGKISIFN